MSIDQAGTIYAAIGVATLAAALLPRALGRLPVSMPMVFVAAGMLAFVLLPDLPTPDPMEHPEFALHLTELCVIVSLMGAGLAVNRRLGWRRWSTTWRLLAITMPLSIAAVALLGWAGLGLGLASALLLGAALAPTDPVLATEVQVSEPITDDEDADDDEARFAITSEAGLNDGLAFPFTYAAIAVSLVGIAPSAWLGEWILLDVGWRLAVGVLGGLGAGWLLRRLFFSSIADRLQLTEKAEGFVALAATFLAYGVTEMAEGYGFIAVFVCATTIRAAESTHGFHAVLHKFVEQIERLLTVAVLVLLGGAVADGLLEALRPVDLLLVVVLLFVIRPLTALVALTPGKTGPRERGVIAFFGVRGVGSLFYIAYALQAGDFPDGERLWAIVAAVILGSILVHGVAATPVMRYVDRRRARRAEASAGPVEATPV
ncbi:cation:proton antiporter [Agrococcus sp. HG114]|uniref:cation:proton antiporter domain-containing protein n=1 Tax=Agrococcus sp. HG114 TaxID=2969757 RepID=UPI00215B0F0D|nr:cation:proton antiporter [Agrococcus sp. HG114]MCR8669613.1 cation:proton antiporter [Agrococcus sp. HG114]